MPGTGIRKLGLVAAQSRIHLHGIQIMPGVAGPGEVARSGLLTTEAAALGFARCTVDSDSRMRWPARCNLPKIAFR
jgi:hypothetical protein